ncbi:Pycsar system effector family protein [Rhizobium leguminosarum]
MAKNDQQEAFEKLMSANHGRMIDFVRFAETKNAALLTFSSVWMGAILNLLRSTDEPPFGYKYALAAALPLLAISSVICLISFLPKLLEQLLKREGDAMNLLYFSDIAKGGIENYAEISQKEYMPTESESVTPTYLRDLAVQIASQATIARRKFRMFHWAGTLVLIAFVFMTIPPVVFVGRWVVAHWH